MGKIKSNVTLSFGLVTTQVDVVTALQPKQGNVTVCTGTLGDTHDPVRIRQQLKCDTCGPVHSSDVKKAREVSEGEYVLLTEQDLADVGADAAQFKNAMVISPHEVAGLEQNTAPGEKAYYLEPRAGAENAYHVLAALVADHPDLAFCVRWTPRSNVAAFRLGVRDGVLVMQGRVHGDRLIAPPVVKDGDAAIISASGPLVSQLLDAPGFVTAFSLDDYRDKGGAVLDEIIAQRTGVTVFEATQAAATSVPVTDALALLTQMLTEHQPPAKKAPAKRATAKKATARKAS